MPIVLLIFVAVIAFGIGYLIGMKDDKIFPGAIVSATYDKSKELMVLTYEDGSTKTYHGSSTVWYRYPMMKRASTDVETELCNIFKYIRMHGNPYPTSHTDVNKKPI